MKKLKPQSKYSLAVVLLFAFTLSACGGGGSSSGGEQQVEKDVSRCISRTTETTILGGQNLTRNIYKNNCDFAVNFAVTIATRISDVERLAPGQTTSYILNGSFIACRAPSVPIDKDADTLKVSLACS